MAIHHAIILGCGRSGTSIFGELFDHLTPFTYHSEPPLEQLFANDFAQPIAVKVPRESPQYPPTPGLSFPLEKLQQKIPEPKRFYWQIRHPLDTIASLRVGIANNWGHHPRPPDWRHWLDRPLLERCAHHWQYINSIGFAQVQDLAKICRFEETIRAPLPFAETICAEVGLDPQRHHDDLTSWANRVQNTNNEHFVEAQTSKNYSRPDHSVRIGRWRENLSVAEVARLVPIIDKTAGQFGYTLDP